MLTYFVVCCAFLATFALRSTAGMPVVKALAGTGQRRSRKSPGLKCRASLEQDLGKVLRGLSFIMANLYPTLLLIDGSSYLFRAYHAMPPLNNSRGEPTGAVFGVIKMLRKQLEELKPEFVLVVFDAKGKNFRHDLYPQYKAHRPPMPEELAQQIEPLHSIIQALGLPLVATEGVEADDVIGTLTHKALAKNLQVVISTGDKDLAQLVNERVRLVNSMDNSVLDRAGVIQKFGVTPEQMGDYLALVGDSSDNIPGVPKVGPKTAVKWLKEFDTLDNIVVHAAEIPGKVGENLRANFAQLALSRVLVTLKCDVPLDLDPTALTQSAPQVDLLETWYKRLELRSLLNELTNAKPAVPPTPSLSLAATAPTEYAVILDLTCFSAWLKRLHEAPLVALDTETTSLAYMQAELVGISFSVESGKAAYVPLAHDYPGAPIQLDRDVVLAAMKPWLEDPERPKLGQHLKYDRHIFARYGINLQGIVHDTLLESYLLNSNARHDLDSLALTHLQRHTITFEELAGKGVRQLKFNQISLEQAAPYAAEDAEVTLAVHQTLWPQLEREPKLRALYSDVEIPLLSILGDMEHGGVLVDAQLLQIQSEELAQALATLEQRAYELAGAPFNLGSPKQIQHILFEQLGIPVVKKTPTGQPSTSEEVLAELALDYPLPKVILEHRGFSKLKSTYVDRLPEQIDPHTGRVHTSYHQAVTVTGRLSSSDPNLQNIPIRTPEGRRIRQAFIAPPGYQLLAADYSQIELRIMAHLSGDTRLCEAFANGLDVHRATAAEVFSVPVTAVSTEQRRSAKAINFGLIYGMSAFGLARQLGLERGDAQKYIDLYFQRYPGVKIYMDAIRAQAHEIGYVETVFGRRLHLPDINSKNAALRQYAERTAINAPMQGTAADIIKRAMLSTAAWIKRSASGIKMIMQVHDELVFEVPEGQIDTARLHIPQIMAAAASLAVPLVVDCGVGANWDQAH